MSKIKQGDYIYIDWNLIKVLNNYGITNGKEIMLFAKIISLSKTPLSFNSSIIDFNKYDFPHLLIPVITLIIESL